MRLHRGNYGPEARQLTREPLEYLPSSTTTVNTDRLNPDDPNFYRLHLDYYRRSIFTGDWTYIASAPIRVVFLAAVVTSALPLVLALSGGLAWLIALPVFALLLVFGVSLLEEKRLLRSVLAAVVLAALTVLLVAADRDATTREALFSILLLIAPAAITAIAVLSTRQAFGHLFAFPHAQRWRFVLADWIAKRAKLDDARRKGLENLFATSAVSLALGFVAYFGGYFYSAWIIRVAAAMARAAPSGTNDKIFMLLPVLAAAALVTVYGFRTFGVGPFIRDTYAVPAPGLWRTSPIPASTRRLLALLAVVLVQIAVSWGGHWGASRDAPFLSAYPSAVSSRPASPDEVRTRNQQFSTDAADVLERVVRLTFYGALAVLAIAGPFVGAWLWYDNIDTKYSKAHGLYTLMPARIYTDRLLHSPITLKGADGEQIRERDHVYIGFEPFQHFPVLLHRPLLHEHCYIVGDSGSGKTSLGLMPLITSLIGTKTAHADAERAAVVVLDLKGDMALFGCTQAAAERGGRDFRYFTPEPGRSSFVFNPFNDIGSQDRTPIQLAELLLDALSLNHGEGYGRSYYSRRNRDFLLDALAHKPRPETFEELYAALDRLTQAQPARYRDAYELLATMRALTFYPQLNVKNSRDVDDNDADLRRVTNEKKTIHMPSVLAEGQVAYFWLPSATESVSVREIGKLALYSLLSAAVADKRNRVYLVIDEFQRLAGENFKVVLEQARSFNVGVILANQSMSELETSSGDLRSVVRSNTRVKMHFSAQNPSDLKDISELSGLDAVTNRSQAISTPIDWNPKTSGQETVVTSLTIKPRLTTSDILSISDHPRRFVLHVTRGSGLTQFGGRALPVEAEHIVNRDQYEQWSAATWPVDAELIVSKTPPVALDQQARHEVVERQRQIIAETFDEIDRDAFDFPE